MDVRTKFVIVVLLSALIVAFESVIVEGALKIADIDIFLVSSVPLISGGAILLFLSPKGTSKFVKGLERKGWIGMTILCTLSAIGAFLWFDAVGRIGASKEAVLGGGSSEVFFIVILSAIFLRERLSRLETTGSMLVIVGVFVVLGNTNSLSFSIGVGEAEAILSSLVLGSSVILVTYLLWFHGLTALSGVQLLYSGVIMLLFSVLFGLATLPDLGGYLLLLGMGVIPAMGLWTYNAGLPKIGASLTSVLFALSGVMTVGVQLLVLLLFPDADMQLPQSVPLAILGGAVAFGGVYLLNVGKKEGRGMPGREETKER